MTVVSFFAFMKKVLGIPRLRFKTTHPSYRQGPRIQDSSPEISVRDYHYWHCCSRKDCSSQREFFVLSSPPLHWKNDKYLCIWYCRNSVSSCNITYVVQQDTQFCYGWIFIHNMFDSSKCFGPTGPFSGASINCVLLVWYVKIVCWSVRPYVRWLFHNHLTYGRAVLRSSLTWNLAACRWKICVQSFETTQFSRFKVMKCPIRITLGHLGVSCTEICTLS